MTRVRSLIMPLCSFLKLQTISKSTDAPRRAVNYGECQRVSSKLIIIYALSAKSGRLQHSPEHMFQTGREAGYRAAKKTD